MAREFREGERIQGFGEMERADFLLLVLSVFQDAGRDEVSLPEVNECIFEFQNKVPVGYSFSKKVLYSGDLMSELRRLKFAGRIRFFTYRHDALLPKTFFSLTPLGKSYLRRLASGLEGGAMRSLRQTARSVMEKNEESFRLWRR